MEAGPPELLALEILNSFLPSPDDEITEDELKDLVATFLTACSFASNYAAHYLHILESEPNNVQQFLENLKHDNKKTKSSIH